MGSVESPLKIAILLNGFVSPLTPLIRSGFESAIKSAASPSSPPQIDFFDPIVAQVYPDPVQYDLIVLSGGTADPMGSQPWVLKMQDFLRNTTRRYPEKKIMGICWGHQTICVAFGGVVGDCELGAEIGVTDVTLTRAGEKMLPELRGTIRMHEFHRREIKVPAEGFAQLAEGAQMFINEAKTIWTFQGHPELNPELGKAMLASTPAYMGVGNKEADALRKSMEREHNGVDIWRAVLRWMKV